MYGGHFYTMETDSIRDLIYIGSAFLSLLILITGTYWNFRFRLNRHEERIERLEEQQKAQDDYFKKTERKLMIIERNLVKMMEKLEVKPVIELCDFEDL